jgi:type II restriction enzyme
MYIIKEEVEDLGLKIVEGNTLERTNSKNLSEELNRVKRNLLIDYGEFGSHLPDVDIIIYDSKTYEVIAVISSKVTLRERIAQTGYWKIKLSQDRVTEHIKVFFITPDEDKTLSIKNPAKKGRAIVEVDTDGSYIMSEEEIEESDKVKKFDKFIIDLKNLIYAKRNKK